MYWQLLSRASTLTPDLREGSNDLRIYREAGEAILRGEIPYRDFFVEYPPGSFPAFIPPAVFSDSRDAFIGLFGSEMALLLVAALVLTALTARRLWGTSAWPIPAVTFATGAIMLYPVATTRYDAVVALTLAIATLCAALGGRYRLVAYASVGLGAAAKLVPALAALPLALLDRGEDANGDEGARGAARGFLGFFAVLAVFFAPAYLLGGGGFLESFAYHAERGLQIESLGASVLLALGWIENVSFEFGAFQVQGRGVDLLTSLSLPISGALLLITAFAAYREHRAGRLGPGRFPRYAAALILAFMIGSKVLSPQYMIWLLPLVPLGASGLSGAGVSLLFLVTCWLTTQVFPTHYNELLQTRSPGTDLLLGRNLLLVILWGLMLLLPPEKSP